ncbi:hypothetical protein OZY43_03615 [Lactobacillus sp. ESL0785]|uniref:hypothetical protein n=1 Tax=Lactobacillus sp. ESL0785 TaxID=2983232 RepID=UPI0023F8285B|nr:hypothetical protein [Lactobacillus sp. ESL0785]WEV71499.1 hypothetical protein OZY43_03615 [Lactobacillus sp. ESL0785]
MIIKVIMAVYLLILLITAYYLWHNRNGNFLMYNSKSTENFKSIMTWTAIFLLAECLLGVFLLWQSNRYLNLITLILSSITILSFSLLINQKNE